MSIQDTGRRSHFLLGWLALPKKQSGLKIMSFKSGLLGKKNKSVPLFEMLERSLIPPGPWRKVKVIESYN